MLLNFSVLRVCPVINGNFISRSFKGLYSFVRHIYDQPNYLVIFRNDLNNYMRFI
jgi:hypothetical protein